MVTKLLHIVTLSLILISCGNSNKETKQEMVKDLGRIRFDIGYPNPPEDPFIQSTLPDSIIYYFKDNLVRTEVNLAKGNIQLNYIANSKEKSLKESMKVYFTKSKYNYNQFDIEEYLDKYPKYQITETGNTKVIAGYTCKEAQVLDKKGSSFYIYYTSEFNANKPNWFTPFPQIDGIVLEYQMIQYNFLMHAKASKIEMMVSDSLSFKYSSDFNEITKEELDRNHNTFEQFGM